MEMRPLAFAAAALLATVIPLHAQDAASRRHPDLAARADSLQRLDPNVEAVKAFQRGDLRLVEVCGYLCLTPGVLPGFRATGLMRIEGTSDAWDGEDAYRLNHVAGRYAREYNETLSALAREADEKRRP